MATEVTTETREEVVKVALKSAPEAGHRSVSTHLNYYDDPGDGSPPTPVVIGGYATCETV